MATAKSPAPVTRVSDGASFSVCTPAWTQAGWFAAELRADVRALLELPPPT